MTSTPRGADAAVRDRLARQVPGLDLPDGPQRFLLVDYTDDSATGAPRPVGWGLQADGSAIVVHASPDDHKSQPIGGAGARAACGVIK